MAWWARGCGGTSARAACVVTVRIRGGGRGTYSEVIAEAVGELDEGVGGAGGDSVRCGGSVGRGL